MQRFTRSYRLQHYTSGYGHDKFEYTSPNSYRCEEFRTGTDMRFRLVLPPIYAFAPLMTPGAICIWRRPCNDVRVHTAFDCYDNSHSLRPLLEFTRSYRPPSSTNTGIWLGRLMFSKLLQHTTIQLKKIKKGAVASGAVVGRAGRFPSHQTGRRSLRFGRGGGGVLSAGGALPPMA